MIPALFQILFRIDKQQDDDKVMKGQQYRYIEDFGEQMVGKSQSVVVVFDLETDELKVLPRKKSASFSGT